MKLTRDQQEAIELFRKFREREPKKISFLKEGLDFVIPTAVMPLGHLEYVGYLTSHGRRPQNYHHDFAPGSRPLLCAGSGDNELYLLGGRYRVTERGIVDLDARLREILEPDHGKKYR